MHIMMEVSDTGRKSVIDHFDSFELAYAALTARPDLVFSEPDADNPGCADAFLSDGRLLVIEPADRR
jgi:hypothetical protein